ncbi:uncharacterized protein DSM5745_03293 [Aspergillus mulundensis]|uniref:Uncharacterized protein n=1 Tax=Aspergillus mulundensis TaxID=1810919 RepID=A0A3D8SKF2_9EURO|nr:hypothetical protein DSM5745_03293 [Aspergillus mulundensis]RDW86651.1 hypothetical protein DSM5745_03293 [Aspergillus mulundensis]
MDFQHPLEKDFVPSPLSFDRVMEGRRIAAEDSRLLRLPVELLLSIVSYIESDKNTLASLALVNSDCRQLARSCQFRTVVFDYSQKSNALLDKLLVETLERRDSKGGRMKRPSLGACIRCIRAKLKFDLQTQATRPEKRADNYPAPEEELRSIMANWIEAIGDYHTRSKSSFDSTLAQLVPLLPRLEILDLPNLVAIDSTFLNLVANSRVKHLRHVRLHGYIGSDITMIRMEEGASWPLESLDIDIRLRFMDHEAHDLYSFGFWDSLFRACSSTLQSLTLNQEILVVKDLQKGKLGKPITFTAEFPRLKFLRIGAGIIICPSTLQRLLQSEHLSTLFIDPDRHLTAECLEQIDQLKSLQTLVWYGDSPPIARPATVHFLKVSPQLRAFVTYMDFSAPFQHEVLSALGTCSSLKVLSLQWRGTSIDNLSLDALSYLTSLEELHISSGQRYGWRHEWFVDHEVIQKRLCTLHRLRKLIFTRDSYQTDNGLEQAHRRRMAHHASRYSLLFKHLEWLHIGQLSFTFAPGDDGRVQESSAERDPWFSAQRHLLGRYTGSFIAHKIPNLPFGL